MKKSKVSKIFFLLVTFSFIYFLASGLEELFYGRLSQHYSGITYSISAISSLMPLVLIVPYLFNNNRIILNARSKMVKIFILFPFLIFISFVFTSNGFTLSSIQQAIRLCIPYLYFLFYYTAITKNPEWKDIMINITALSSIVISIISIRMNFFLISLGDVGSAMGYFSLLMLPYILLCNKKIIKYAAIAFLLVAIFSSSKRGGILSFFFAFAVYFFIRYFLIEKKNKILKTVYISFVFVALIGVFYWFVNRQNSDIIERIENIENDQGSGRVVIWENVLELMGESTLREWLIGHGIFSTAKYTSGNFSAHNDFLQLLFDNGIFVFLLLIGMHISLIKKLFYLIRIKSVYAASFGGIYVCCLFLSMISHVVIYPWFPLLTAYWGIVYGLRKDELVKTSSIERKN
ncbi:MAG: O-antigen ligase family protein [Bacteroidales bacterium]|nr:O-antigen ligase family protein [Bacteroidales bacterium]